MSKATAALTPCLQDLCNAFVAGARGAVTSSQASHILQEWWQEWFDANTCLSKLKKGEPFFVLRGNDPCAPVAVDCWVDVAIDYKIHTGDKLVGATKIAKDMRAWLDANSRPNDEKPN